MKKILASILAAGKCERFGLPKFLLVYGNKFLLERTIQTTRDIFDDTVVITGYYHNHIEKAIKNIKLIFNADFQKGMSSSIKKTVLYAQENSFDGVCIIPSDMPFLHKDMLQKLRDKFIRENLDAVAFTKNGAPFSPAIFSKKLFPALMKLEGDKGAKAILKKEKNIILLEGYDEYLLDVDTEEDCLKIVFPSDIYY